MKNILWILTSVTASFVASFQIAQPVCVTSSGNGSPYSIDLCIEAPAPNAVVEGVVSVQASLEATEGAPGISKLIFYLNDEYLLTDFEAPFRFELPTNRFVDGDYTLSAEVTLNDEFVSEWASLDLVFANGVTEPPVNENTFQPYTGAPSATDRPFTVAVVGDGASGQNPEVPGLIASWNPDMFLYLGDVYNRGTYTEFYNWYGAEDEGFAQFRSITNPTIGDHEYSTDRGAAYFDYWDNVPPYYSFDAAGWHFFTVNTIAAIEPATSQYDWLVEDLSNNTLPCVIGFFHHPIYSIGPHGGEDRIAALWPLMVEHGVDAVFNGNEHSYQRWQPLNGAGEVDPQGVTEFIVGVGGRGTRIHPRTDDRVGFAYDIFPDALGAVQLELNENGMSYKYININGVVLDSGVIACDSTAADTIPPAAPENLQTSLDTSESVTLTWSSALDDTGVAGYTIYRDGAEIGSTAAGALTYSDTSAHLGTTYTYTVAAFDLAGNHSPLSDEVSITTPSSRTLTLEPIADTYISEEEPAANYGSRPNLRLDASPELRGYLRFQVPSFTGTVTKATLEIYANSGSTEGFRLYSTTGDWDEESLTYENAPSSDMEIASAEAFTADTWIAIDVGASFTGDADFNMVLVSRTPTAISLSSREGDNPPRLIIEVAGEPES